MIIICESCNTPHVYGVEDIQWEQQRDSASYFYVLCRRCGSPAGTEEDLKELINLVPEGEYDRAQDSVE